MDVEAAHQSPEELAGPPSALERFGQTVRDSLRFDGRAPISELIHYVLCVMFFHLAIGLLLMLGLSYPTFAVAQDLLQVLYFIPVPALLARRLHDQGRSGNLLWIAVPGVALWIARKAIAFLQPALAIAEFDRWTWPLDLGAGFASLALIIVLLLPGTVGPNRFAPDPRPS